jgi:DNA sulfur modification protein DndD
MWISKIELINFKSYQNQSFSFPAPKGTKNLCLIGGMNGFGKTTLLEAIYLCLYGSEATSHLGRAGLAADSYGKFLKNAFHGKAKTTKKDYMAVNIAFEVDSSKGYEIRRKWHFNSSNIFDEEDLQVCETSKGNVERFLDKEDLGEILLNYVVPPHVAPFFFFDGEELKRNAEINRTSFILMGLENLLGVVHLRNLKERLENYANARLASTTKVDKQELEKKASECEAAKEELEKAKSDLQVVMDEIEVTRRKRDEVHSNIQNTGAGSGDKKQIEDTLHEEGQRRAERDRVQEQLSEILTTRLPFNLISKQIRESTEKQLNGEQSLDDWTKKKDALTPQKGKFKLSFFEEAKHLEQINIKNKELEEALEIAIDKAWESIYTPQPEGCADSIIHSYLDSRTRQKTLDMLRASKVSGSKIKELSLNLENLNSRIEQLSRRRVQLQSILDDGQLQEWLEELKRQEEQIENLKVKEGDLTRQISSQTESINNLQAMIERERKRLIDSSPERSYASKAQKVIDFINELLPRLFLLKTQEVSEAVTKTFKQLAHKNLVDKIIINERGESKILDENGKEITVDISAGEKQMLVTAIIAGLAQVSGFDIPMIVDTPLGRLDSEHRNKILDYWMNSKRQVILLSQDKEIGNHEYELLKKHVAKTYLLEHKVLGDGIGKTIAYEDKYFEGAV